MGHIIDSRFYGNGYSTAETRTIFEDGRRHQRWLDVEAALATTQGELGVIPMEAAKEIAAQAHLGNVDAERVAAGIARTNHSLVPLLREIQAACKDGLGEYIHYGVTTQDVEDTGAILEARDVLDILERDLTTIATLLADLAEKHRDTVMAGRTHGQHALPTAFGYRVAIWLGEVMRHLERIRQARPRICVVSIFGGVGTRGALPQGLATMKGVATKLGLEAADISWHTARDNIAEFVMTTALVAASLGKIANEIYVLAKTEFGELAEPHHAGKLGSSTMPHKRNPEFSEQVAMLARLTKYQVSMALESMGVEHDRDGRAWRMDWVSVPEVSHFAGAALAMSMQLLDGLVVNEERMAENLRLQKDFMFSEALMISLGENLGKMSAHTVVYEAAMTAHTKGTSIIDQLLTHPAVSKHHTRQSLDAITDPRRHLGEAGSMTDAIVAKARALLQ
jgi:adenylosuccinate lyase